MMLAWIYPRSTMPAQLLQIEEACLRCQSVYSVFAFLSPQDLHWMVREMAT